MRYWVQRNKLNIMTFSAYVLLITVLVILHEPWRDEMQAWLLARDNSFLEILGRTGYSGHPFLWYYMLKLLNVFNAPVAGMYVLHILIISTAVVLLFAFAPFDWRLKLAIPFSYFFLYEYSVLARNYAIGVLLLFIIAILYDRRFEKQLLFAIVIFFLVQTSVICAFLAIPICIFFTVEAALIRKDFSYKTLSAVAILAAGYLFFLYQLYPPEDLCSYLADWRPLNAKSIDIISTVLNKSFFPKFSKLYEPFFPTGVFDNTKLTIGLTAYGMSLALLIKRPRAFFLYFLGTLSLLVVFVTKYPGSTRHHGFIFLFFIFCFWISYQDNAKDKYINHAFSVFLAACLFLQTPHTLYKAYVDGTTEITCSQHIAKVINQLNIDDKTFIAGHDVYYTVSAVGLFEDVRQIYRPTYDNFGSFVVEDKVLEEYRFIPPEEVLARMMLQFEKGGYDTLIFISNEYFGPYFLQEDFALFDRCQATIVDEESMSVYVYPASARESLRAAVR